MDKEFTLEHINKAEFSHSKCIKSCSEEILLGERKDNTSFIVSNGNKQIELQYYTFDFREYEVIDTSNSIPINFRKIKLSWNEYFKKLYNITLIMLISTIIYIYYYVYRKTNNTNTENNS